MATLSELYSEWKRRSGSEKQQWFDSQMDESFSVVSTRFDDANVILYFSSFLQQPGAFGSAMEMEDKNSLEYLFDKMDLKKELVIIMHTPGGSWTSVESVLECVHNKFKKVTIIVPDMSLSTGAMFCLSCDKIIISRDGQLGSIDMEIPVLQTFFMTRIASEYFNKEAAKVRFSSSLDPITLAKKLARYEQDFFSAMIDKEAAKVPFPFSLDPALAKGLEFYEQEVNVERRAKETFKERLQKKGKTLEDAEKLVELIPDSPDRLDFKGEGVSYESMRARGVDVQELEEDQELQNAVMTAYNLAALFVKEAPVAKWIISDKDNIGKIYIDLSHPTLNP